MITSLRSLQTGMFVMSIGNKIVYENPYCRRDPGAGGRERGMIWSSSIRFLASFVFRFVEQDKSGIISCMARQARIPGASNQTLNPHFRSSVANARRGPDVTVRKNRTGGPEERLRSAREPQIAGRRTRENSRRRYSECPAVSLSRSSPTCEEARVTYESN